MGLVLNINKWFIHANYNDLLSANNDDTEKFGFEGGIHVPAFANFYKLIERGNIDNVVSTIMDMLPTFTLGKYIFLPSPFKAV